MPETIVDVEVYTAGEVDFLLKKLEERVAELERRLPAPAVPGSEDKAEAARGLLLDGLLWHSSWERVKLCERCRSHWEAAKAQVGR